MVRAKVSLLFAIAAATPLSAENRLAFKDGALPAGGTEEPVPLWLENDVPVLGFSFGVRWDPAALRLTDVEVEGTLSGEASFFDGIVDAAKGLAGFGCVLDWDPPIEDFILPGGERPLARLLFAVLAPAGSVTALGLETVRLNPEPSPPVKNVLTDDHGRSIAPQLVAGTISIEDWSPRIVAIEGNRGRAGDVFTVVGERFAEPGLLVKVCGAQAAAELAGDGRTLSVTAPSCGAVGFAPLEVCTVRGCDAKAEGFEYIETSRPFVRGEANRDGSLDVADAITVLLCLYAGSVQTTCPDALDADDDGEVRMADAIYVVRFLFLAGPVPPAPYPEEGDDPTEDLLEPCR
ncbi:MAG: hypothetical protein ACUVYA_11920 [Planctomycetota bacterium]